MTHSSSPELPQATPEQARELTDRIKVAVEATWELVKTAYVTRAWTALGYSSWDDYCTREFGASRIRLPREERPEVVASLRESGMSYPAIAAAAGMSAATAYRASSGFSNEKPEPQTITGTDGKQYRPQQSAPRDKWTPPADPFAGWSNEELDIRDRINNGETVVVSLRDNHTRVVAWATAEDKYVRVDRRSEWGNPFETPADGDRGMVIRNYDEYYLPHKPSLLSKLPDLRGRALGCWCAPLPCHGDVLKARADS